ncbi:MAG: hypothetical protein LUI10_08725 [Lachnospiraceae bacterium]|nr:hypothetical protein [Lachnospiraceae bacterium]
MAEKELRKMNRTELIEIIYALQQNEKLLRRENEDLHEQLQDKAILMEQAGDIRKAAKKKEERANALLRQAERECREKLEETERECAGKLTATEQECMELLNESKQKARDRIENVNRKINLLMKKYPMLREYLKKENGTGGAG